MTFDERQYLLIVSSFIPFGPQRIKLLLSYFDSAEKIWKSDHQSLLKLSLSDRLISQFMKYKSTFNIETYFKSLRKLNINFTCFNDKDYPENLKGLDDAPVVLYYRGYLKKEDRNSVAIVGSRKMSSYGKEVTEILSTELSRYGIPIVSGLALGIDAAAHNAVINAGGRAIAVLGTGVDTITPYSNYSLGINILKTGGCIISEYPLKHPVFKENFARRNRIISGLSKAVIVIEGERKSGTLLTASAAADQGRQVFAVPGQITSPNSEAPHFLIKNGAKLITSAKDILEELDMQLSTDINAIEKVMPTEDNDILLFNLLTKDIMHLDELVRISGLPVNDISARLTIMELKGMVKSIGNGMYKKV